MSHSWHIDYILHFNNQLLKWIMQISTETWSRRCDRFLNLHNSLSTVISISLFLSSLLSLLATKTPGMAFRHYEKLKTCDESEYTIWQLDQETCQIQHTAEIKFQFISRADYWIQRMKSIFQEWINGFINEVTTWMGLTVSLTCTNQIQSEWIFATPLVQNASYCPLQVAQWYNIFVTLLPKFATLN